MLTFQQQPTSLDAGDYLQAPTFGDLDGDDDFDAVVGVNNGILRYFENTGTVTNPVFTELTGANDPFETYNKAVAEPPIDEDENVSTPVLFDIDGDGDLDLIFGRYDGTVNLIENTDDTTDNTGNATNPTFGGLTATNLFDVVNDVNTGTGGVGSYASPTFADIDGDDIIELIVGRARTKGSTDTDPVKIYDPPAAAGDPYTVSTATSPFASVTLQPNSRAVPAFADVDGDGDVDAFLAVTELGNVGTIRYFRNDGTANAPNYVEVTGADNPFNALNGTKALEQAYPAFADVDNDGLPDPFVGTRLGAELNFFQNQGVVTPPPPPPPGPGPGPGPAPQGALQVNGDNIFTVGANNGATNLLYQLTQLNTNLFNEVGLFKVDNAAGNIGNLTPGSSGYVQAAIARSKILFSAHPFRPNNFNIGQQDGILDFQAGDRFAFYLVRNGTTDAVLAGQPPGGEVILGVGNQGSLRVNDLGGGQYNLRFDDDSNGTFEDVFVNIQQTGANVPLGVGQLQQQGLEVLDLLNSNTPANLTGQQLSATFTVYREAAFNNLVSLYRIDDASGTVNGIAPGQAGYAEAAMANRIETLILSVSNQSTRAVPALLESDALYAPFMIANASVAEFLSQNPDNVAGAGPQAYFPYIGANPDGVDHIRLLGNNVFGFEDLSGGGDLDYNDIIFQVDFA
ncbi:MAG: DUF4114 domain-containing protein [Spirulinaceae cyanobacterium]